MVEDEPLISLRAAVTSFVQQYLLPFGYGPVERLACAQGLERIRNRARANIPLTAACACGAVQVHVDGGARHVFTCHCRACAAQTGEATTWTAVSRVKCRVRGPLHTYSSSRIARRTKCARCDDAILMDYSAPNTLYVADARPTPSDLTCTPLEGGGCATADADIYWESRSKDAKPTSRHVFEGMPLGRMGFVHDPGRDLEII